MSAAGPASRAALAFLLQLAGHSRKRPRSPEPAVVPSAASLSPDHMPGMLSDGSGLPLSYRRAAEQQPGLGPGLGTVAAKWHRA